VGRDRGEQRETLAAGAGVARQPRPEQFGAVRDGAAREQSVWNENAGVENLAWDENLANGPDTGYTLNL
jgi:hypothetical protein